MLTVCYRIASYGEALWKIPNLEPARFHVLDDPPTQYVALHPLTAWAEVVRNARLPRAEIRPDQIRVRLWALRLDTDRLVRVDFETAARHAIGPDQLVADDQGACRELGRRLRADGHEGLVYPSSALPGTACACVFGERHESPYLDDPVDLIDVPTSGAAENGEPLRSLLRLVRLHGEAHAALQAHLRGARYQFNEPDFADIAA
jgi:hypothetical protein